jgi:hypothetical protein
MTGVEILTYQLVASCNLTAQRAEEAEPYWRQRPFAAASLPGFITWHCTRIIDWGVHTVVRDVPELASRPEWRDRMRYEMGHGAGLSDAEADSIAADVQAHDVIDYARALRAAISDWLGTTDDAALDQVPDLRARNQTHPRYRTPEAWEEIKGLEGVPAWQLRSRPGMFHIRTHAGELEALTQLLKTQQVTA